MSGPSAARGGRGAGDDGGRPSLFCAAPRDAVSSSEESDDDDASEQPSRQRTPPAPHRTPPRDGDVDADADAAAVRAAAAKLMRTATTSPTRSPRRSLFATLGMRVDTVRDSDDSDSDDDADVTREANALVSAASRGDAVATRALKEALRSATASLASSSGGDADADSDADANARAAGAIADAVVDAVATRLLPGAPEASARAADARAFSDDVDDVDDDDVVELSAPEARCDAKVACLGAELLSSLPPDAQLAAVDDDDDDDDESAASPARAGPRRRLLRALLHAFRASMTNCVDAARHGAFPPLVRAFAAAADANEIREGAAPAVAEETRLLGACVRLLASHALPTHHLRAWLKTCATARGRARGTLLDALDGALSSGRCRRAPSASFALDGESSGLLGPASPGAWPFNERGFTFATWVFLESTSVVSERAAAATAAMARMAAFTSGGSAAATASTSRVSATAASYAADGENETHMPRLFSFISTEPGGAQGVEAYFHGAFLVLEANGGRGKVDRVAVPFMHAFALKTWTCVAIEYRPPEAYNVPSLGVSDPASHGEVRLHVNGVAVETHRMTLPRVSGSLGFCCVGTNPPAAMAGLQSKRRQCALYGHLGPVYVFREYIGGKHVSDIAARGASYVPGYGASPPSIEDGGIGGGERERAKKSGGKKIAAKASAFAGAAAKAFTKAAAKAGEQLATPAKKKNGHRVSGGELDAANDDEEEEEEEEDDDASASSRLASSAVASWTSLDASLAPALFTLLHPATMDARKRVPDLSPSGIETDRHGSALGSTTATRVSSPRESLWAAAAGGPSCVVTLLSPTLCPKTFQPRDAADDAGAMRAAGAALRPALSVMASAGEGRSAVAIASLDAMSSADAPRLIARALPHALHALRETHEGDENALDDAEVEVVKAVERLLEASRRHPPLRARVLARLFVDFTPWLGGEIDGRVGVGARAMMRVIRASSNVAATLEGGVTLRKLCGTTRLLDAARRYLSLDLSGSDARIELERGDGDDLVEPSTHASNADVVATGGLRNPTMEDKVALVDELALAISTLVNGADGRRLADEATRLVHFLADAKDACLASRVLSLARRAAAAPNRARAETFTAAFLAAGGAEIVLALVRAAALGATTKDETDAAPQNANFRRAELVAACARLLGHLVAVGAMNPDVASRAGVSFDAVATPALVERAMRHCLRRAPRALLTEETYDAALNASLDGGGGGGGGGGGAENLASMTSAPARLNPDTSFFLGAALEALPRASRVVKRRAVHDVFALCCVDDDARNHVARMPEWPSWLVSLLVTESVSELKDDDLISRCGDVLDVLLQHAVRQREGWRVVEGVVRAFEEAAEASTARGGGGGAAAAASRACDDALAKLATFTANELGGLAHRSSGATADAARVSPRHRRAGSISGDSLGGDGDGDDAAAAATDSPLAVMRENAAATLRFAVEHMRGARHARWFRGGGEEPPRGNGLPVDAAPYGDVSSSLAHFGANAPRDPELQWRRRCWLATAGEGDDLDAWMDAAGPSVMSRGGEGGGEGGSGLALLRAAAGLVETLAHASDDLLDDVDDELLRARETKQLMLCVALACAREEAFAAASASGSDGSYSASDDGDGSDDAVTPPSVTDALAPRDGSCSVSVSPSSSIAFDSRAVWGVEPGGGIARALALLHHLLSPWLGAGPPARGSDPPLAEIGALFDEVWSAARRRDDDDDDGGGGGGGGKTLPAHAKATCAYLLALLGRWRTAVASACSDDVDDGSGTMAAAAAAGAALRDASAIRAALSSPPAAAVAALTTPPWIGVLGSASVAAALASATAGDASVAAALAAAAVGGGDCGVRTARQLGRDATRARWSSQRVVVRAREDARAAFAVAWERGGPPGDVPIAAKWRRVLYASSSRRGMAAAAAAASDARGEKRWKDFAAAARASGALYARVAPSEGDEGYSLSVASTETARRRRYQLKSSYAAQSWRGKSANDGGGDVANATTEKPRLPYAGAQAAAAEAAEAAEAVEAAEAAEKRREEEERERQEQMMIAAATAAAAAAASGNGDESSLILQCDADIVTPTGVAPGRLQITTRAIIFQCNAPQPQEGNATDSNVTFQPADDDAHLLDAFGDGVSVTAAAGGHEWRWPLDIVHSVQTRRYLLKRSALEIFLMDRSAYFIDVRTREQRARVYSTIAGLEKKHCARMEPYAGNGGPEALFRKSNLTQRWCRREISNFDYLMALNTMSGRTYNDITQYPVFPWVIADYESETLDFNDPKTFRDLSKPVGALNEKRLERFEERYDAFDDPDIPKFHYGSHYSSAGIVLFYLRCLEPFTTLSRQLAGNKFDHADRLFHDIPTAWKGVNSDMSDVKELIPEFFYLPEMFQNVNKVDFGKTQTGEALGDVKLPKWASSPFDFVAKNRAALESEHVSNTLHLWIDLVFGCKQRGNAAEKAKNVFYYLTYEGNVDMESITDPVLLSSTRDQIANFGQTPSRLTTRPHPPRLSKDETFGGSHWLLSNPKTACKYPISIPVASGGGVPLVKVAATPGRIVAVTADLNALTHKFSPNTPDNASLPFTFQPARESGAFAGFMRAFGRAGGKTSSASVGGDSARG